MAGIRLPEFSSIYVVAFCLSFFLTIVFTRFYREVALSLNLHAHPGKHKIHSSPIPYLGGLAVFTGFFVPTLFLITADWFFIFFLASLLVTGLGLLDDIMDLSALTKLLGLFTGVFISAQAGLTSSFFPSTRFGQLGSVLDTLLTLLWVVLIISAINAIDNMDGLATGMVMIPCFIFFTIGIFQFGNYYWTLMAIAMAGALLVFLPYNFHPAVIFLGDSGSFFLGFFISILAVLGDWSTNPVKAATIPLVILSIPLLDLVFVVLYRYLTGVTDSPRESIEFCGQDHISHRIQQVRNFGQKRTVIILYVLALISGLLGVVMRNTLPFEALATLITMFVIYGLIMLLLLPRKGRINWRWKD